MPLLLFGWHQTSWFYFCLLSYSNFSFWSLQHASDMHAYSFGVISRVWFFLSMIASVCLSVLISIYVLLLSPVAYFLCIMLSAVRNFLTFFFPIHLFETTSLLVKPMCAHLDGLKPGFNFIHIGEHLIYIRLVDRMFDENIWWLTKHVIDYHCVFLFACLQFVSLVYLESIP